MNLLYNKDSTIGRLLAIFASFFPMATKPTRYLLTWFLLGQLALKSAPSVRYLYRQFLSGQTDKALTSYYHALANERITNTSIRQALAEKALQLIPQALRNEPVFLSIDDTTISKFGKHFDDVSILYDHANHEKPYTNGHCFVSLTISVPVLTKTNSKTQIRYLAIPLGYALWDKSATKLELAAMLLDEVMPALEKRQVILLFDSWYAKRSLIAHALAYENLEIVCNARCDTAIYEMPNSTAGRRGRPPKYGKKLTLAELSDGTKYYRYRMDKLFVTHQQVKTRIFGNRSVHAYVTTSQSGSRRLFFSTLNSMSMHMSIAWQENKALNGANSKEMEFYPLRLYKLRWGIETNYYEQKMFWNLSKYMVRQRVSIEHMMNLTNIAHATVKMLPYLDAFFQKHQNDSTQELRSHLSQQIQREIFFSNLVRKAQTTINSGSLLKALQALMQYDDTAA